MICRPYRTHKMLFGNLSPHWIICTKSLHVLFSPFTLNLCYILIFLRNRQFEVCNQFLFAVILHFHKLYWYFYLLFECKNSNNKLFCQRNCMEFDRKSENIKRIRRFVWLLANFLYLCIRKSNTWIYGYSRY